MITIILLTVFILTENEPEFDAPFLLTVSVCDLLTFILGAMATIIFLHEQGVV